jgi:hypothetical protein
MVVSFHGVGSPYFEIAPLRSARSKAYRATRHAFLKLFALGDAPAERYCRGLPKSRADGRRLNLRVQEMLHPGKSLEDEMPDPGHPGHLGTGLHDVDPARRIMALCRS